MMRARFRTGVFMALCAAAFFSGGCREAVLTSGWRSGEIVVDGFYRDWTGLSYFDNPSMFIGARNDGENLYLMVKTVDQRAQLKVMRLGLTVWIEPEGHPERTWGIHYPVGLEEHGITMYGNAMPDRVSPGLGEKIAKMLGTIEYLGPEPGKRVESLPDRPGDLDHGIRAAARDTAGVIVYELKVPLRGDAGHPYALWTAPGDRVNLRFATGDIRQYPERRGNARPDPNRDTSTGKLMDKGRDHAQERERMHTSQRMPMLNPLTEPIEFRVDLTLAAQ